MNKRNVIITLVVILCALALQIIPGLYYYQDYVYDTERAAYDAAKAEHDSVMVINRESVQDSLKAVWIATNDTSLRKVKKVKRIPEYSSYGYYKRTGRLECEENHYGKMICQPEKEWVVEGYYVSSYKKDTVWTAGYKKREEWIAKSEQFAEAEAKNIFPEFHEYDGHAFHYIVKSDSNLNTLLYAIYAAGMGIFITIVIGVLGTIGERVIDVIRNFFDNL